MSSLTDEIIKQRSLERTTRVEMRKLDLEIKTLEEEVKYAEGTLEDRISTLRDEYIEEQHEKIKASFEPKIKDIEEELEKVEALLQSNDVEETEELIKARETKEYLNTAAIVMNRYYEELKKISTTYFIDLAYNEKRMKLSAFKKEFATIPYRMQELESLRTTITQPFTYVETKKQQKTTNYAVYFTSTVLSWWVALTMPYSFYRSVKRANYLHDSAFLYHKMMHTLVSLKNKTDEEIAELFSSLLELKQSRLRNKKQELEDALEAISAELEEKLALVEFDESSVRRKEEMQLMASKTKLESLRGKLEQLEFDLKDIMDRLEELTGERRTSLEAEREQYLQAREEKEVVLPERLLYDYTADSNAYLELNHGLYLYEDREDVTSFLQLVMFQLRNIMEWGAIQFRILDLLGAEFASPLMLPISGKARSQDISIYSLKEEREQLLNLTHDLLVRRRLQILQTVSSLGDYNLLQKASGSSPTPYQIIFIILNDTVKMDEKLIQLIHNGEKVGLLVFIFMKQELLTVQVAKSIEVYFKAFVELTDSGLSNYGPEEYRIMLEQQEADKKSNM